MGKLKQCKREILLLNARTFAASRESIKNNAYFDSTPVQRVKEAYENGLLTCFPGNGDLRITEKKLSLKWRLQAMKAFLCIELYQTTPDFDSTNSLNPHKFLSRRNFN